jgi:autophagy-related protein 9
VYNVGRDIVTPGGSQRQGPIHLQTHLSKKDKALWNWVNVDDLDEFLQEVYTFYVKKGIWSIALAGFLDLL